MAAIASCTCARAINPEDMVAVVYMSPSKSYEHIKTVAFSLSVPGYCTLRRTYEHVQTMAHVAKHLGSHGSQFEAEPSHRSCRDGGALHTTTCAIRCPQ